MPTHGPDRSFLYMAVLAGTGGVLAIVASIGVPIWMFLHGHRYDTAFSLFTGWGIAALGGAYGCLRTYRLTDTPPPTPRGGLPVTLLHAAEPAVAHAPAYALERPAA